MYIGKVIGTVVATIKISHLDGHKLLLVDQLDLHGKRRGNTTSRWTWCRPAPATRCW